LNFIDTGPWQKTSQTTYGLSNIVSWDWETLRGEIRPDLATSWTQSADGLTYTFTMRDGVTFHDGSPFGARDAVASIQHCITPIQEAIPPCANFIKPFVESVSAPDASTLVITLKDVNPVFLANLAPPGAMGISPKHILDRPDAMEWMKTHVLGTGAFSWSDDKWERGISWTWEKYDGYFEPGLPYLDSIRTFVIDDTATRTAAFETKQLDELGRDPPPTVIKRIVDKYGADQVKTVYTQGSCNNYMAFNVEHPPFDNPLVRQALYLWVDRTQIAEKALPGGYFQGEWITPEASIAVKDYGTTFADLQKNNIAWDPDKTAARAKALELLETAGVDPSTYTVELVPYNSSPSSYYLPSVQVYAAQLREMGFKTEITTYDAGAAYANWNQGNFDIMNYGGCHQSAYPDVFINRTISAAGASNKSRLLDPEFERMMAKINTTVDPQKRSAAFAEMDAYLQTGTGAHHNMYWRAKTGVVWEWLRHSVIGVPPYHQIHTWLGENAPGRN
jgi:peptide/nickel transport system substrate-binding protein